MYKKLKLRSSEAEDVVEIDKGCLVSHAEVDGLVEGMVVRGGGEFVNKAIFLNDKYDWVFGKDETDNFILVPLKKEP